MRAPSTVAQLHIGRSIVVGHIYQLGTKYSEPLGATFQDEDGTEKPYRMGSYGIGITRILAALVEQHHDDDGIVLAQALAPFEVVVILANHDDERRSPRPSASTTDLAAAGVETRPWTTVIERAGVKFADADLIGYPVQVTVGKRGIANGTVDLKLRATGERINAPARRRRAGRGRPPRDRTLGPAPGALLRCRCGGVALY